MERLMAKQPKDEKNASDFMKLYENNFTDSIMEKGTQKISYIPWASAWAEVKKPEWTWRGSSDSCPLKPCAHKVHEKSEV